MSALQELERNDNAHELWESQDNGMPVSEAGKKVSEMLQTYRS